MSNQIDIAVDLGAIPPPLPGILTLREFAATAPPAPPQIIKGVLHQGGKMILGGTSKSNKSWSLMDLALSIASGQKWWGHPTTRGKVLYLNFELHAWAVAERINHLCGARPECQHMGDTLHFWNLRGHNTDLTLLRPKLQEVLDRFDFTAIIMDPAYKLLGGRDENSNGDIADLMNEFEALCRATGAAIIVAHHFAKGNAADKDAMDRMSGAGAWARDPDSLIILTPHEEPDCFTASAILRNLPRLEEFVLAWDFPLMRVANELNPAALRRPQSKNKVCSDREFVETVLAEEGKTYTRIVTEAETRLKMSRRTTAVYLKRLTENGLIKAGGGLYWVGTV